MNPRVIIASPYWTLNGPNIFSARLAGGLIRRGFDAEVLLTQPWRPDCKPLPFPDDVVVRYLPVSVHEKAGVRRRKMTDYLEQRSPCIYIPNNDYDYSCVSPCLSRDVKVVGIVHSDDPEHYEHARRLGKYWDAVVAVSKTIRAKTLAPGPECPGPVACIPYGVPLAAQMPARRPDAGPLKIVYAGRLVQYQKRVLDVVKIITKLAERNLPFTFFFAGGGRDEELVRRRLRSLTGRGMVRFLGILPQEEVLKVFAQSDVFIMTSEFEGMPIALLEAMGQGCVPVVSDIESGVPELVRDGVNGFCVPIGDVRLFVDRLVRLQREPLVRAKLARAAYATVRRGRYGVDEMVDRYVRLFRRVMNHPNPNRSGGPGARVLPPPRLPPAWGKRIPDLARSVFLSGKPVKMIKSFTGWKS